jgi:hypothetical protein
MRGRRWCLRRRQQRGGSHDGPRWAIGLLCDLRSWQLLSSPSDSQRTGGIPRLRRAITKPDGRGSRSSTYERILAAVMRYSAVVNYVRTIEIPLLPRHLTSSSSSASTAASQPTPATFADGLSAPRVQQHPQAQGPHAYVQRPFAPPGVGNFSRHYFQLMHAIIVGL